MHCVSTDDDAPHHIHNLQHAFAVDDDVAVVDEGEGLIVANCVPAIGKHQAETRSVIGGFGREGVRGRSRDGVHIVSTTGQQVNVRTRQIINQVQVIHFQAFGVDRQGVGTVLLGLEIDGYLVCRDAMHCVSTNRDNGIFLAVLRDVNLRAVFVDLEFGQGLTLVEAHNGAVDDAASVLADVHHQSRAIAVGIAPCHGGLKGYGLVGLGGFHEDAFHRVNSVVVNISGNDFGACRIHPVERRVADGGIGAERVADKVPAVHGCVRVGG